MTTYAAVIRAAIPDADESDIDHILWGRTPFPCRSVTARELYRAASGWRRAVAGGKRLCDHCHRLADDNDGWECLRCETGRRAAVAQLEASR